MESKKNIHRLIERYVMGLLDEKEAAAFKQDLANDKELLETYKLHEQAVFGINSHGDELLKEKLDQIHEKVIGPLPQRNPIKLRSIKKMYSIAAAAAILLACGLWYFLQPTSNGELFAQYYQPSQINQIRDQVQDENLFAIFSSYNKGAYNDALSLLQNIPEDQYTTKLYLTKGLCELELKKYKDAIKNFEIVIDKNDLFLKEEAIWYAALTYLKCNEKEKAVNMFKQLAQSGSGKKQIFSKELLKDLNE